MLLEKQRAAQTHRGGVQGGGHRRPAPPAEFKMPSARLEGTPWQILDASPAPQTASGRDYLYFLCELLRATPCRGGRLDVDDDLRARRERHRCAADGVREGLRVR